MRPSLRHVAEGAAWLCFLALAGAALLVADRLGFGGLFLLGAAAWLVCVRAELDGDVPTWGVEPFRAGMGDAGSPEGRAAARSEREALAAPLRLGRRCGVALTAVGALGFLWQQWGAGAG